MVLLLVSSCSMFAQFNVFKPTEYKPVSTDYSKHRDASEKQEKRRNQAYQNYSELAQLIGENRQLISNDIETLIWFEDNINSMTKRVESSLNIGDYSTASNLATKYIGEIYSHTELNCRIRTYKEYVTAVQSVQERTDLSYQQKQAWFEMYKYKFVPICDAEGKILGAYNWMEIGGPDNTRVILP